jgi:hypothetical protein
VGRLLQVFWLLSENTVKLQAGYRPRLLHAVGAQEGTREQLSTLYRLSLSEYLRTAIILDDQLVQSDDSRMDWFRALLTEKAQWFSLSAMEGGVAKTGR